MRIYFMTLLAVLTFSGQSCEFNIANGQEYGVIATSYWEEQCFFCEEGLGYIMTGGIGETHTTLNSNYPIGYNDVSGYLHFGHALVPELRSFSRTYDGVGVNFYTEAGTQSYSKYQYIGPVTTTITLNLQLDGSIQNDGQVFAGAAIGSGIYQLGSFLGLAGDYHSTGYSSNDVGFISEPMSIDFELDPGDIFYLELYLGTLAEGPNSFADASSTLVGEFSDPTYIVALSDVVSEPTGDFDGDDDVDGRDFLAWQRGESPEPFSATDLADWQSNYLGNSLAASTTVPEPSAVLLLSVGLLGLLARRHSSNA